MEIKLKVKENFKRAVGPFTILLPLLSASCASGGKHPVYGRPPNYVADTVEFKGGPEYNDRKVVLVPDTTRDTTNIEVPANADTPNYVPKVPKVYTPPTQDTITVPKDISPPPGCTVIDVKENGDRVVVVPSQRFLTLLFEGNFSSPPVRGITKIVDKGDVIEVYDSTGLVLRVKGLPGDTVVVEERTVVAKLVNGREVRSYEMMEKYREKGSFSFYPPKTNEPNELQYRIRISKSVSKPIPQPHSDNRSGVVPSSVGLPGAFNSPLSLTPTELAAVGILFNIQNPQQWYDMIRTLRAVNGGSLDPADLKEFFIGPYYNSILALRGLGYAPNATADLNAAVAFGLYFPWLYGNIGGKAETRVVGSEFVSSGTPYFGLTLQDVWHAGGMQGTHNLGARFAYNVEKGYTIHWPDTTTVVSENRGWSLDLGYRITVDSTLGLSLGVNNLLYSIYGTRVVYDPSLKEIGSETDIYIRPPTTLVTGLAMGTPSLPILVGLEVDWPIKNIGTRSITANEIKGGISVNREPFYIGFSGSYPIYDPENKRVSVWAVLGNGGHITGGGSMGADPKFKEPNYGLGLYGRTSGQ